MSLEAVFIGCQNKEEKKDLSVEQWRPSTAKM